MVFIKSTFALSVLTLCLAGCGGGGGGSGDDSDGDSDSDSDSGENVSGSTAVSVTAQTDLAGSFKFLGFVEIIQDDLEDRVNRDANFLQLTQSQDAENFRNSVPMSLDSCSLTVTPTFPTNPGVIGFPEVPFNLVSAGESFSLSSAAGTYANIILSDSRFDIAPYPVPTPLSLDIPGAQFPAFVDVAIPDVVAVQNFQPGRNETLQADSVISWTPTGLENHAINIGTLDIVASDRVVDLRCRVADDGAFSLPSDIVDALNSSLGAGFSLNGVEQNRRTDSLIINGDALLVVSKSLQSL